jgi:phosphoglycerate dehydrogenase-like enzyme
MSKLVWLTERGERHQQAALNAAPAGVQVEMLRQPSAHELQLALEEAAVLVSERRGTISADMMRPELKLIVRLGSLVDDIDLVAAQERGIIVSRQPVPVAIAVAEHIMMQTLALLKHVNEAQRRMHPPVEKPPARTDEDTFSYNWTNFQKVQSLYGKTLAIAGMGEIGVELARRLQPFSLEKVLYNKRTPYPDVVEAALQIQYADFETCVTQADILVNLLPYSEETDSVLSDFHQMKAGSFLVHAGSGSTLDEGNLVAALGHLAGAALDTYEYEPLPADSVLLQSDFDNLLLTPHIAAGVGHDRRDDYAEVIRWMEGEPLRHRVI